MVVVLLARNIRRGDQDHLDVDTLGGWHKVSAKESVNLVTVAQVIDHNFFTTSLNDQASHFNC